MPQRLLVQLTQFVKQNCGETGARGAASRHPAAAARPVVLANNLQQRVLLAVGARRPGHVDCAKSSATAQLVGLAAGCVASAQPHETRLASSAAPSPYIAPYSRRRGRLRARLFLSSGKRDHDPGATEC